MKISLFKRVCWGNWLFFIIVSFLFIITLLSACGTKGGLYMPEPMDNTKEKTTPVKKPAA
ncbi:MAG: lipoprotein [Cocleimonas sp.]|nr:lipoprotein [Cocleimonas sp.]